MFQALYGTAATLTIPIQKRDVLDFAVSADWTPATGDVKVSIDGGDFANITTLPALEGGTGSAGWTFALSAAELTGKRITVQVVDSATKAVEDQAFVVETFGHASANDPQGIVVSVDLDGVGPQTVTLNSQTLNANARAGWRIVIPVGETGGPAERMVVSHPSASAASCVFTLDRAWDVEPTSALSHWYPGSLPATLNELTEPVTDLIGTPTDTDLATDLVNLDTLIDTLDTLVDAIKAKTDSLTFTTAGIVDANVQQINDVTITGDGSATPYGV